MPTFTLPQISLVSKLLNCVLIGGGAAVAVAAAAADWLSQSLDITCTDIIMALQELGDNSLNHHSLQDYIRTVHSLSPHPLGCSV